MLFGEGRAVLGRVIEPRKGFLGRGGSNLDMLSSIRSSPLTGSMMVLSPTRDRGAMTQSYADFGTTPGLSGDHSNKPRLVKSPLNLLRVTGALRRFDQVFNTVLEQLQPVCVSEQKFLTSFFHFAKPSRSISLEDVGVDETDEGGVSGVIVDDSDPGFDGVQGVLGQLLGVLLPEIESFINYGERMDG